MDSRAINRVPRGQARNIIGLALLLCGVVLLLVYGLMLSVPPAAAQAVPDCGNVPYRWNPVGGHWEREFSRWCYPYVCDPNEIRFHGLTWDEAQELADVIPEIDPADLPACLPPDPDPPPDDDGDNGGMTEIDPPSLEIN